MNHLKFIMILFSFGLLLTCNQSTEVRAVGGGGKVISGDDKILLEDRTGKKWDITHAVRRYGFVPSNFQFGLGPNAIPPIQNPQFSSPGKVGFPLPSDNLVIGTRINEIAKAYPIIIMKSYEIANDNFNGSFVAAAY